MNKILIVVTLILISGFEVKKSQKFNYRISGNGKPTIIVDLAMGETLQSWHSLQTRLCKLTTVVTYDRLGLGKSDTTSVPRTIENLSIELNEFLTSNGIPGPYLLIGHSLGTSILRKYQNDHHENVLGMILIDPVHEDQFDRLIAIKSKEDQEKTIKWREKFEMTLKTGERNEAIMYHQQMAAMRDVKYPTNIPITIIGSFRVGPGASEEDRQIKKELFNQWLNQAPQIKLVATTKSGHYIQDSEPELLIDEVKLMIEKLRTE
ncbi:MAG: alpha/beta hydrolase [Cyclobacteriaceae bacterium]|nr:alpha/beta hydrolase [Cyclobacteriaceae bacterium]